MNDVKIELVGYIAYPDHSRIHQQDWVMSGKGICRTIPAGTHASTPHLLKILIVEDEE